MSQPPMPTYQTIPAGFKAIPLKAKQLSLSAVLRCGQSFRWSANPLLQPGPPCGSMSGDGASHEFRFCLKDRVVCLRQTEDSLFYRSIPPGPDCSTQLGESSSWQEKKDAENLAFIRDYFQLDIDLLKLYEEWSCRDIVFRNIRNRFSGIRILRQDPWECLISFICSSNNNISRITKMVHNLCTHFSPALPIIDTTDMPGAPSERCSYHPFPPPSALSAPSVSIELRELGFGYRANFIQKTAAMLLAEHGSDDGVYRFLDGLRRFDTEEARAELLKLMGVGRKVADCVLLMSLDKPDVVPVDTHVYQIAVKHYGLKGSSGKITMSPKLYDDVNAKLTGTWGAFAGWAHSILFTADLKAFATYGLPTPSPSTSPKKVRRNTKQIDTPSPSPSPRKRKSPVQDLDIKASTVQAVQAMDDIQASGDNLVDRVKRRRRIIVSKSVVATAGAPSEW